MIKNCLKWKRDGCPPKPKVENESSNAVLCISDIFSVECDDINWYVDNGATNHVWNNKKLFKSVKPFDNPHKVTTANGIAVDAIGHGDLEIEIINKRSISKVTLSDVWLVPDMTKNLFSVLSAHDTNPNSKFISTTDSSSFEINGKTVLTGQRTQNNGLYKLNIQESDKQVSVTNNQIKQICFQETIYCNYIMNG